MVVLNENALVLQKNKLMNALDILPNNFFNFILCEIGLTLHYPAQQKCVSFLPVSGIHEKHEALLYRYFLQKSSIHRCEHISTILESGHDTVLCSLVMGVEFSFVVLIGAYDILPGSNMTRGHHSSCSGDAKDTGVHIPRLFRGISVSSKTGTYQTYNLVIIHSNEFKKICGNEKR
ncbi:hypothetical protein BJV82DRAFT_580478 [Fennellomyces sp. T-0311]|nr:hypothetical protein BJV82DRAFT_580478 [Fennellomyces sp. T-0311]